MNASELITRLAQLDNLTVPRFVMLQDGNFTVYTVNSVSDDGTMVVEPSGILDVRDSTDVEQ